MPTLNFANLLSYGAIGLGCILAVLAFFLLRKEQDKSSPRKDVLTSIYAYMLFSLCLAGLGFAAEAYNRSEDQELAKELRIAQDKLLQIKSASMPLLNSREFVIGQLPDNIPEKQTLLHLVNELKRVYSDE